MERLEGGQLESLIYHKPRPSWDDVRRIIYEIGEALEYAHSRGLIHRDVKPSNVFITSNATTKLLDFGIAIHTDNSSCTSKARLGSPCYMAPEQILGKQLDGRTDLYALGMTAYERSREVPFNETTYELYFDDSHEVTPDVSATVHDCPKDLVEFVQSSIEEAGGPPYQLSGRSEYSASSTSFRATRRSSPLEISLDYGLTKSLLFGMQCPLCKNVSMSAWFRSTYDYEMKDDTLSS